MVLRCRLCVRNAGCVCFENNETSVDEDLGRIRELEEGESHLAVNLEGGERNTGLHDVIPPELLLVGHIKGRKNFGVETDHIYIFSNISLAFWPDLDKLMRMLVIRIKNCIMAMNFMPLRCTL